MPSPPIELSSLASGRPAGAETDPAPPPAALQRGAGPGVIVLGGAHGSVAVARSLGRQGIPVWFVGDDHPIARYSRYVRRRLTWNRFDSVAAVAMLCGLAQHEGAAGWVLFPSGDTELQIVSQHHAELSHHFRLFTMPWDVLLRLNDKTLLYRLAEEVGAAFPRTYEPAAGIMPAPSGFPLVIKPASSEKPNALTKAKAWRIDTPAEFEARYPEAMGLMGPGHVVVQEMIPGDGSTQFSYCGLWDRGREIAFLTARRTRQFPIDFGMTSSFVETMPVPEAAEAARRILGAVGFHGLVEVEFKHDTRDGGYKVLDANSRAWAWIGLGSRAGVDFPYLAWRLATGQGIPDGLAARRASWLYPTRNLLSLLQQWRRGGVPAAAWGSMLSASTSATFAWDDPMPGLLDFPIQVGRVWRRLRRNSTSH